MKFTRKEYMQMIRIGYDDNNPEDLRDAVRDRTPGRTYDRERKREVYIPEYHLKKMLASYGEVVVHDFGDDYHLSEEERLKKSKYYRAFKELACCKKKIRKITDYIKTVRIALHCLDLVAADNDMIDPMKFKRLVLTGKIELVGFTLPKYIGKDKKEISKKYLTEFILSGKDPEDFLPKQDSYMTDEEKVEQATILFDEDQIEDIQNGYSDEEQEAQAQFFDLEEGTDQLDSISIALSEKRTKKLLKNEPALLGAIKDMQKKGDVRDNLQAYGHDYSEEDFEKIDRYDRKHGYTVDSISVPEFHGDIMNDRDFDRYMYELTEWEESHVKAFYQGKNRTLEEIDLLILKADLEENGWDIRKLYGNREKKRALEKAIKKDKKEERKLKDKLIKVQDRRNRRMGKEPKKKHKKKEGKRKETSEEKHRRKENELYKNEAIEATENILMNAVDRKMEDFEDYEEEVLDWSWGNIMS